MPFVAQQTRYKALPKQYKGLGMHTLEEQRFYHQELKSFSFDHLVSWVGITVDTHRNIDVDKHVMISYFMVLYFGRRFLLGHEPPRSSVLYLSVPQKVGSLALCVHSVGPFNVSFSWSGPSKVKWTSSGLSYWIEWLVQFDLLWSFFFFFHIANSHLDMFLVCVFWGIKICLGKQDFSELDHMY